MIHLSKPVQIDVLEPVGMPAWSVTSTAAAGCRARNRRAQLYGTHNTSLAQPTYQHCMGLLQCRSSSKNVGELTPLMPHCLAKPWTNAVFPQPRGLIMGMVWRWVRGCAGCQGTAWRSVSQDPHESADTRSTYPARSRTCPGLTQWAKTLPNACVPCTDVLVQAPRHV